MMVRMYSVSWSLLPQYLIGDKVGDEVKKDEEGVVMVRSWCLLGMSIHKVLAGSMSRQQRCNHVALALVLKRTKGEAHGHCWDTDNM